LGNRGQVNDSQDSDEICEEHPVPVTRY
jgi:hypothetical protein